MKNNKPLCKVVNIGLPSDSNRSLITEENEWLTSAEAAEYLQISVGRLNNLASDGKISHYKLERSNRYRRADLRSLLLSKPRGDF